MGRARGNNRPRRFEFRRPHGHCAAEQFSGLRGRPKWPEAPGVCKFRLIEKNDEVPGYLPRVHFQPLFLFRCVLPEWPLGRAACTAIYIRARWNGLSRPLALPFSKFTLSRRLLRATLVRAFPTLLPLSLSLFFFFALFTRPFSLAAVPPRIYTLFSAGNCLSLGAARGSTYERSRYWGVGNATPGHDSESGDGDRLCPESAFNKDR